MRQYGVTYALTNLVVNMVLHTLDLLDLPPAESPHKSVPNGK